MKKHIFLTLACISLPALLISMDATLYQPANEIPEYRLSFNVQPSATISETDPALNLAIRQGYGKALLSVNEIFEEDTSCESCLNHTYWLGTIATIPGCVLQPACGALSATVAILANSARKSLKINRITGLIANFKN